MNLINISLALLLTLVPVHAQNRLNVKGFGSSPPKSTYVTTVPTSRSLAPQRGENPLKIALKFARNQIASEFVVKNVYQSKHNGVTHVYLRQLIDGLEVVNGDMNINVDKKGNVISFGNSFYNEKDSKGLKNKGENEVKKNPQRNALLTPEKALLTLYDHLGLKVEPKDVNKKGSLKKGKDSTILLNAPYSVAPIPVKPGLIQSNGGLERVWEIIPELEDNWIQAHVSAETGQVKAIIDWVADASYNVIPLGDNDPETGERRLVKDPHDNIASPQGWHELNQTRQTTTIGNNVYAQENHDASEDWLKKKRPDGGKNLIFDHKLDLKQDPNMYLNATITNLFYWNNIMHDLYYRYGFNEEAGNFQEDNRGRGGYGGDSVIAYAQYGNGKNGYKNNASFSTPPDGSHGKMKMFLYTRTDPRRDGALDNDIVVHEYTHGLSNRLTGGPANSRCLGYGEPGGMGEGWGDFVGTILQIQPSHTRKDNFAHAAYANNKASGNRKYMYSTDMKTNPTTYRTLNENEYQEVHAIGNVWANILYEVYWNLVDKLPFTSSWFPPTTSPTDAKEHIIRHGNTLALQLVIDGMKLQPCRPTFLDARDAILQADQLLTNGANKCEIWKGFAKRGVGVGAKYERDQNDSIVNRVEDFEIPKNACEKSS
ncbi:uncharacterized protein VTP21DRAFT_2274 [Calcarisporiella thermophila]|uniref:uncharacterized protein n=1 Tax=Calcarisporiella thermophila TaxID=911321 RepID=UPI003742F07F